MENLTLGQFCLHSGDTGAWPRSHLKWSHRVRLETHLRETSSQPGLRSSKDTSRKPMKVALLGNMALLGIGISPGLQTYICRIYLMLSNKVHKRLRIVLICKVFPSTLDSFLLKQGSLLKTLQYQLISYLLCSKIWFEIKSPSESQGNLKLGEIHLPLPPELRNHKKVPFRCFISIYSFCS